MGSGQIGPVKVHARERALQDARGPGRCWTLPGISESCVDRGGVCDMTSWHIDWRAFLEHGVREHLGRGNGQKLKYPG